MLRWISLAVVVAMVGSALPRDARAVEPIATTGVIVGSTIGAGLPPTLTGLGAGTGVYAYTFSGVSLGSASGSIAIGGAAATAGAVVLVGVAIGLAAWGGYKLYRHVQRKRAEEARLAVLGLNVPRDAATTGGSRRRVAPGRSAGGAAGAGIPR